MNRTLKEQMQQRQRQTSVRPQYTTTMRTVLEGGREREGRDGTHLQQSEEHLPGSRGGPAAAEPRAAVLGHT